MFRPDRAKSSIGDKLERIPVKRPATPRLRDLVALLAGVLIALGGGLAHADNTGRPMRFQVSATSSAPGDPIMFADGDFVASTPGELRRFLDEVRPPPGAVLYLNSAGGDLAAGMEVGQILRDARLTTSVGQLPLTTSGEGSGGFRTGYCISACSFAFLGGVERSVPKGSVFAVHQVSMNCVDSRRAYRQFPWLRLPTVNYCPDFRQAMAIAQSASSAVVEYVLSMGVDPLFLSEMAKADPDAINRLSENQLEGYRIIFSPERIAWSFEPDERGAFFLKSTQANGWREHKIEMFCDRASSPRLLMWLLHDTRTNRGRADAFELAEAAARGLMLRWGDAATGVDQPPGSLDVQPYEIVSGPEVSENQNLSVTLDLTPRMLDVFAKADWVQIVAGDPSADPLGAREIIRFDIDREKVDGIVRSCR